MPTDDGNQLTHEDKTILKRIAESVKRGDISRRDLIKLGIGGAVGGALVGSASADASTSDSDGDIGTPNDRVDVFADGVNGNSVTTDDQTINSSVTYPDGTTITTSPSGGVWEEDANSPVTASGSSSLSGTLSGEYDAVKLVPTLISGDNSNAQDLQLTVNGDTGANYGYVSVGGSTSTGQSNLVVARGVPNSGGVFGEMVLGGKFSSGNFYFTGPVAGGGLINTAIHGYNNNISSPLDSFTFQWSTGNITADIAVLGLNP